MDWAWLAIGVGALVVVTRAPLVIRPPEAMVLYRGLVATDPRVRACGMVYFAGGLASLAATLETSGLARQCLLVLAIVFLAATVWMMAAPAHFRGFVDGVLRFSEESVDAAALRGLGMLGVGVGALLIIWGARAL